METIIHIETCADCKHSDHTGAFTEGGAKPCCNHPHIIKTKGVNCFKRIIPFKNVWEEEKHIFYKSPNQKIIPTKVMKGIPSWCPVKNGEKYQ